MVVDELLEKRIQEKFREKQWSKIKEAFELILSQFSENLHNHYIEILLNVNSEIFFYHIKGAAESISFSPMESQVKEDFLDKILEITKAKKALAKLELTNNFFMLLNKSNFVNGLDLSNYFFISLQNEEWECLYPIIDLLSSCNVGENDADYLQIILKNLLPITPSLLKLKHVSIAADGLPLLTTITCYDKADELLAILRCNPFSREETPYRELIFLLETTKNISLDKKPISLQMLFNYRLENRNAKAAFEKIFEQVINDYRFLVHPPKRAFSESQRASIVEGSRPSSLQQFSITNAKERKAKNKKEEREQGEHYKGACTIC